MLSSFQTTTTTNSKNKNTTNNNLVGSTIRKCRIPSSTTMKFQGHISLPYSLCHPQRQLYWLSCFLFWLCLGQYCGNGPIPIHAGSVPTTAGRGAAAASQAATTMTTAATVVATTTTAADDTRSNTVSRRARRRKKKVKQWTMKKVKVYYNSNDNDDDDYYSSSRSKFFHNHQHGDYNDYYDRHQEHKPTTIMMTTKGVIDKNKNNDRTSQSPPPENQQQQQEQERPPQHHEQQLQEPDDDHDALSCFTTKSEAAAIGSMVLSSLLTSIVQVAHCDPHQVGQVMEEYFRPDVIVQLSNGTIVAQGLDQVKDYLIHGSSTEPQPSGTFTLACSQYTSWTTQDAVTMPYVENEFVVGVNQVDLNLGPTSSQEEEELGRYFAMELFSGRSDRNTLFSQHYASHSCTLPKHCQQPQIYAVIFQPTFHR